MAALQCGYILGKEVFKFLIGQHLVNEAEDGLAVFFPQLRLKPDGHAREKLKQILDRLSLTFRILCSSRYP